MNDSSCQSMFPDIRDFSSNTLLPIAVVCTLLSPVTVLSNMVLLVALVKTKSIGLASQSFAVALCVNDLLIGALLEPTTAAYLLSSKLQNCCVVRWVIQWLSYCLIALDLLIICSMGIERLIVLRYALSRILLRWTEIKKYLMAFVVLFAIAFSTTSVLIAKYTDRLYLFNAVSEIITISLFSVTVIAYILAYRHVRRNVLNISRQPNSNIHVHNKRLRHDIALGRSLVVILTTAFALFAPLAISEIIWTLHLLDPNFNVPDKTVRLFLTCTIITVLFNSIANVFIYSYYNRPVRQYIVDRMPSLSKSCFCWREKGTVSSVDINDTKL